MLDAAALSFLLNEIDLPLCFDLDHSQLVLETPILVEDSYTLRATDRSLVNTGELVLRRWGS